MMKKMFLGVAGLLAATLLAPQALAQSFTATLSGSNEVGAAGDADGSGVAVVSISGTTVNFSILANLIAAPTAAHIHRGVAGTNGPVVVDFKPAFKGLNATGSVTAEQAIINEIAGNPSGFYVNVHNAEFTAGAIRGQLASPVVTEIFYPTVVKAPGLNNTFFVSDLAAINTSASAAVLTVEAFLSNPDGLTAPSAIKSAIVPAGGQLTVSDVLGTLFGVEGRGAARIVSDQPLIFSHRVLNDRRAQGEGASLLNVASVSRSQALTEGYLAQLSQASPADQSASVGFRTNIGWFNPGMSTVKATFRYQKADGSVLASVERDVKSYSQVQVSIFELFPAIAPADLAQSNFYISFSATGGPLFVYSTVVENKTGDGLYQSAQPKP